MGHFGDTAGILVRFPGSTQVIHDSWFSDPLWTAEVKDKVKIFCFRSANSMAALMGNHNRPEISEKKQTSHGVLRETLFYHVASLVAPCASPLLLLWSVLVAPEILADPSMTKWLDPTFKTPFPGDLYISTLTWPPPQCELQSPFLAPEKWQEMSANPKAGHFKDSPKETPRIATKDISRVSQGFTLLHADLQLLLPVLQTVPGDLQS